MKGQSGRDLLDGGGGADRLAGDGGSDTADFSARIDRSRFRSTTSPTTAAGEADDIRADVENIIGGGGRDRIIGNPFANCLKGNGGNDTIYGGFGNDTIDGGAGRDRLSGQQDDDTIFARDNNTDRVDGGGATTRRRVTPAAWPTRCWASRPSSDQKGRFVPCRRSRRQKDFKCTPAKRERLKMLRPMFSVSEQLESRILLADFASLNGNGTLSVVGTAQNNSIVVQFNGSKVEAIRDGVKLSFNKSQVKRIWINAFNGNDRITNKTNLPSTLIGSGGDDRIVGGVADHQIDAGGGNDHFDGGLGRNRIHEGDGIDAFDYSAQSGSQFTLGQRILVEDQPDGSNLWVSRNNFAGIDFADGGANLANFIGTPGNDQLIYNLNFEGPSDFFDFYMGSGNDSTVPGNVGSHARLINLGAGNDHATFNYDSPVDSIVAGSGDDVVEDNSGYGEFNNAIGGSGHDAYTINPDIAAPLFELTVPDGFEDMTINALRTWLSMETIWITRSSRTRIT